MLYSSLFFIYGFLPFSLLAYYAAPKKSRENVLLALSLLFCGLIGLWFLAFTAAYVLVNYSACRIAGRGRKSVAAGAAVAAACVFDGTAILAFRTKYFDSLLDALRVPVGFFPLGISFLTLSALGTLAEIYSGKEKPEKDIRRAALYYVFFPKLLMGPLMRRRAFNKALAERREGLREMGAGFTIFAKGLAKKVVVADSLLGLYDAALEVGVSNMSALTAWLGAVSYILCLYFTLSGFSDMGAGLGRCFGLRLPQSFNYPMFSVKIKYFGARWQIQVVSWFRRYVARPAFSFSRSRFWRRGATVLIWGAFWFWYVFDLGGFIWGVIFGAAVLLENRLLRGKKSGLTGSAVVFLMIVCGSVFLSQGGPSGAARYFFAMIGGNRSFADQLSFYLFRSYIVVLLIAAYLSTGLFRNMLARSGRAKLRALFAATAPAFTAALLLLCTVFLSYSGTAEELIIKL